MRAIVLVLCLVTLCLPFNFAAATRCTGERACDGVVAHGTLKEINTQIGRSAFEGYRQVLPSAFSLSLALMAWVRVGRALQSRQARSIIGSCTPHAWATVGKGQGKMHSHANVANQSQRLQHS